MKILALFLCSMQLSSGLFLGLPGGDRVRQEYNYKKRNKRNLFLSISATQTGTATSSLQDFMESQLGWREQPDVSQLKVLAAKLEVSQEWPPCVDLNICLKISLETVGARETARFVSVAAVSKTATASVTLTAVRINVSEKVVFRAWTSIMGMDATPTNTTEIMFWQQYLK